MRVFSSLLFVLAAASALAQTPADALRGTVARFAASDLPDAYRAVSLGDSGGPGGLGIYGLMGIGSGGGESGSEAAKSSLFFALLVATFVDPDEFAALLDGKRPRVKGYAIDFASMIADSTGTNRSSAPTPVFVETWIEAGRVLQWSPRPALTKARIAQVFGKSVASPAADATAGLSNVKQVALGFIMYSADADDKFPKAASTGAAKALVMPYIKSEAVWTSPSGGRILYNTALSGVSQTSIERVAETLLVWEENAGPDGTRAVGFTDGHAKRLSEVEWSRAWKDELRRRAEAKARESLKLRP